eukprot:4132457-Pyramimonas_sp.AAC.1
MVLAVDRGARRLRTFAEHSEVLPVAGPPDRPPTRLTGQEKKDRLIELEPRAAQHHRVIGLPYLVGHARLARAH